MKGSGDEMRVPDRENDAVLSGSEAARRTCSRRCPQPPTSNTAIARQAELEGHGTPIAHLRGDPMKTLTRTVRHTLVLSAVAAFAACGGLAPEGEEAALSQEPELALSELEQPIIGGAEASPGEWPWQAQLNKSGSHWCGGSLIADRWVLTAAHCVQGHNAASFQVNLGVHKRSRPNANVQTRSVSQLLVHPSYNASTGDNDVALMELSSAVSFTKFVQPIALSQTAAPVGGSAFVTGFGNFVSGSGASDTLKEAMLPIQSTATCNAPESPLSRDVTASMVCAGYLTGEDGGCHGDSGGPLVMPSSSFSNGWELVGVVSWGVGFYCNSYTVFARVSALAGWVLGEIGTPDVYGDVDADGCVDMADHDAIVAAFGQSVPPANASLDLNDDGLVNMHDRLIVLQNFGEGC
jgi:hypothetical protein